METPKFFFFDLGNVLLRYDQQVACQQVSQLSGLSTEKVWDVLFTSGLQERYERGELSSRQFFDASAAASDRSPAYERFHQANSQMFELNISIVPVVVHLKAAGCPLGILSNTCEAHWRYVSDGRYCLVSTFFDLQVLSFEERCWKPQPAFFEKAAKRAAVEPRHVFFVDDRSENVAAARQIGFDAVVFRGPRQLARDLRSRGVDFNY